MNVESYTTMNCEWVIEVTDKILKYFAESNARKVDASILNIYVILHTKSYRSIRWSYGKKFANTYFRATENVIKADFKRIWYKMNYGDYWAPGSRGFKFDDEIKEINNQAKLVPDGEILVSTTHAKAINHWMKDINKDKETK